MIHESLEVDLEGYFLVYIDSGILLSFKESEGELKVVQRGPGGRFAWCLKEVESFPMDEGNMGRRCEKS